MARPSGSPRTSEAHQTTRSMLLVVDLEPVFRAGLQSMLETGGHAVEPCELTDLLARLALGGVDGLVLDARADLGDYCADLVRQARAVTPARAHH